jgi:ureidoacrylate peracid hydrolase
MKLSRKLFISIAILVTFSVIAGTQAGPAYAAEKFVNIQAKPEPVKIDLARSAVVVVDMQNAFASKGGMFDLVGQDISGAKSVIENNKKVIAAARAAGVKVVYLVYEYAPDMSDSGGPGSPNWYKEFGLVAMNKNPQYKGKFLIRGSWDAAVVDELKPQPGDVVIGKSRYSGFRGTSLDVVLKTYNIKYLIFTGIATNVCVESTLRDGYFLDYWPILVSDGTNNAGPPFTQQATLWNIEALFGWVTTTNDIVKAMSTK